MKDDLISRQAAIEALYRCQTYLYNEFDTDKKIILKSAKMEIMDLPSAHPDTSLVTWLLDEVWDEDLWELNCRSFPEVLCRKLVRYGYLKVEDGKYVRLDKQARSD